MHDPAEMPDRLARFLTEHEPEATDIQVVHYEAMTGGYSRILAAAHVTWRRNGATEEHRFVLRGDPPPDRSLIHTDRRTEWEVLRAVAERCNIAGALYFDPTGDRLGTPAIVLQHAGTTSLLRFCAERDELDPLPIRVAEAAASIHRIADEDIPSCIARPASYDDYLSARIDEWRQTASAHIEAAPILNYVAGWLDAHRPPPVPLSLIHGDFQSANLLVDDAGDLVILDWELAQIGDPREDLGYFKAVAQAAPPDLIADEPFFARYRELTGFDEQQVNPAVITYFLILGVIGTARRLLEGGAAYARGENHLLTSLFNLNSVQFAQDLWLRTTMQLEAVTTTDEGAAT